MVLGNPPWERVKLQEKEWFATRDSKITNAPNAATRRKLIAALPQENPSLFAAFQKDKRKAEGESHFIHSSDRYPLCGRGDINTFAVFAELTRAVQSDTGRVGIIVPSGIATDDTTKFFFQDLMESKNLTNLYDFENRDAIFPGVHRSYKFCLLTLTGAANPAPTAEFIFFAHAVGDLAERHRRFSLSAAEIALLNPSTHTCPIFRSQRDAELTKAIYRNKTTFKNSLWAIKLGTMFHSSNDADKFDEFTQLIEDGWQYTEEGFLKHGDDKSFPLYEGKMFSLYDHRAATVIFSDTALIRQRQSRDTTLEEHCNPYFRVQPFFWVRDKHLTEKVRWFLCFKKVTSSTNERTLITTLLPTCATNDSIHLLIPVGKPNARDYACLNSAISSFVVDYVGRQKLGGVNFNFFVFEQLPFLPPQTYKHSCPWLPTSPHPPISAFLLPRVLELTYTAWDLQPFARDCGYHGPPFRWDEERRFLLRCELDAAYFHLYGIERADVDYIMETFPLVKRKNEIA